MPAFDWIVSVMVLAGLAGLLVVRALRAWADYRIQKRAVDLLVQSMTELEEAEPEHRP
jgi:hypothetical protein